jgi:hypothetical protein
MESKEIQIYHARAVAHSISDRDSCPTISIVDLNFEPEIRGERTIAMVHHIDRPAMYS